MPKPEREFFRPDDLPWRPAAGSPTAGAGGSGITEKVLAEDPDTGDTTRLLRFAPGSVTADTIAHDFWEEVWIVEGTLVDRSKGRTFSAGMYACRPPGMRHGPYESPGGALLFESRYRARVSGEGAR